jgi:hypothetical protein
MPYHWKNALKRREIGKRKEKKNKAKKLRRPGRPSFLLALSPRRRLGDALKTLLSIRKLAKNDFQLLINKIAHYLPGWKASLMHPVGQVALIRVVHTAAPIHHFIAVNCPKWVHETVNKIIRAFLWKGRKEVQGGHCLVGWQRICRPRDLGGLGILNLEVLGWAL